MMNMQEQLPPGAMPGEKSDDIEAKLSSGEFVVPAEVVRYFGVKTFEDMINQAQDSLQGMQSSGRIQGDEAAPMQQPPVQMATGGLAQAGKVVSQTLPDGRVIYRYVDAQGNPVGNQMGNQLIGGQGRTWAAPGDDQQKDKEKPEERPKPDPIKPEGPQSDAVGGPGGAPGDGGPTGKGFGSFSDFADAATEQLGNVADKFGRDVESFGKDLGRDLGMDVDDPSPDMSTSPDAGIGGGPGGSDDGPGPGGDAGVDTGPDSGGVGPDHGESDSGSENDGAPSGESEGSESGDAYKDGGLVMPKGLHMKSDKNTGKKVPPGLDR